LQGWLAEGLVKKLVLVVTDVETEEVQERWVFEVETDTECVKNKVTEK
jgi:mitotic spindle assembly checkpoint protein MAD2